MLVSTIQQCESIISMYLSPLSLASLPSTTLLSLGCYRAPSWAPCFTQQPHTNNSMEIGAWQAIVQRVAKSQTRVKQLSILALAIYFTQECVYMSKVLSQFVPPSPSSTVFTNLFSTSASSFLLCKYIHQYHSSRFHVYALVHNICFSLSDLLCSA